MSATNNQINGQEFIDAYIKWLKESITSRPIPETDYVEFTTPFLDRHNDYTQFYVRKDGDQYFATDGGNIINELEMSGVNIDTPKRQELLQTVLNGFGVTKFKDELQITFTKDNFPQAKNCLIQAMLAVDDLFYLSSTNVQRAFIDDVLQFFDQNNIFAIPDVSFTGRSTLHHKFDFAIPKSKKKPERLVRVVSNLSKQNVESVLFSWDDTRKQRSNDTSLIAIFNDEINPYKGALSALKEYEVKAIPWSRREENIEMLTA